MSWVPSNPRRKWEHYTVSYTITTNQWLESLVWLINASNRRRGWTSSKKNSVFLCKEFHQVWNSLLKAPDSVKEIDSRVICSSTCSSHSNEPWAIDRLALYVTLMKLIPFCENPCVLKVKLLVYSKWKNLVSSKWKLNWPCGSVHLIQIYIYIRCNSCGTTYLGDGDRVVIPVDGEDVHEAYEGLEDDEQLNNSKQKLLHDDTGWHEKFTSVLSLVEQGVNGPTSTNRSFGTNSSSHNQTLNYQDKILEAADCSKRRAALYYHSARAASSSAHTDNIQSHRDPRSRLPSHHQQFANWIATLWLTSASNKTIYIWLWFSSVSVSVHVWT